MLWMNLHNVSSNTSYLLSQVNLVHAAMVAIRDPQKILNEGERMDMHQLLFKVVLIYVGKPS